MLPEVHILNQTLRVGMFMKRKQVVWLWVDRLVLNR